MHLVYAHTNSKHCPYRIGLYWHELRIDLNLRPLNELTQAGWGSSGTPTIPTGLTDLHYLCNFQYLDRPERAMFANQKLEQIFIQVQYLGEESFTATDSYKQVNIRWNQPVTDLMFVFQNQAAVAANDWLNFAGVRFAPLAVAGSPVTFPAQTMLAPPYQHAQIFLNNNPRTIELSVENFSTLPAQRGHYRVPHGKFIGSYPFGVEVDGLLHSGSVNFSRMDTAYMRFKLWSSTAPTYSYDPTNTTNVTALAWNYAGYIHIFARNFNLAKMSLGMLVRIFIIFPSLLIIVFLIGCQVRIPFFSFIFSVKYCFTNFHPITGSPHRGDRGRGKHPLHVFHARG
jgi:hypothetical protein